MRTRTWQRIPACGATAVVACWAFVQAAEPAKPAVQATTVKAPAAKVEPAKAAPAETSAKAEPSKGDAAKPEVAGPIKRVIPPAGVALSPNEKKELEAGLKEAQEQFDLLQGKPQKLDLAKYGPDAEVFLKAVRFAVENQEFYSPGEVAAAKGLIAEAKARASHLEKGNAPWAKATGLVVRGYKSALDGSVQPYGLVIPEDLDLTKPVPLYLFLHGRGEKMVEAQFIQQRLKSAGDVKPKNGIVLHPFGRYCNAFKFAGEVDVLEAIQSVQSQYKIDPDRIVLTGFSMGGAGVWHIGAHYAERFCAVAPGAGFAETAKYTKLQPENYPPPYAQALWGWYDSPDYVRNLFNTRTIAYSGELDKQIQAAQVMEAAFEAEGRKLTHLIGPGTPHKYHPETLKELHKQLLEASQVGRDRFPLELHVQTRTLRYGKQHWAELLGLQKHWQDSRLDASVEGQEQVEVKTKNVTIFRLTPWIASTKKFPAKATLTVDGQKVAVPTDLADRSSLTVGLKEGKWAAWGPQEQLPGLSKRPGLQGPIDDAFMGPYLLVTPSGSSGSAVVDAWVKREIAHFQDRCRRIFRGDIPTKTDAEVTQADFERCNVFTFGDPTSNALLKKLADKLPVSWTPKVATVGHAAYPRITHVPAFIYPNPAYPQRYLVVNSGLTFREQDDSSNAKQIPKLPDWAVVDVTTPSDGAQPGKVVAGGFFDERWQWPAAE